MSSPGCYESVNISNNTLYRIRAGEQFDTANLIRGERTTVPR